MRTSDVLRGHLRLMAPWLKQVTAANKFDREIADTFLEAFQSLADQADAPVREVAPVDPHPGPSVRFVEVPAPFNRAVRNVVPFLPRNPE